MHRTEGSVPTRKRGFTFVELIVGLAILMMIAAVVLPVLFAGLDRARVDTSADILEGLAAASVEFEADVGHYPGQLTQLVNPITTAQQNVCGENYTSFPPPSDEVGRWAGPYVSRVIEASGFPIGVGHVFNQLERLPTSGTPNRFLIAVDSVPVEDAELMDTRIDGELGADVGTIRYTSPPSPQGTVVLRWAIVISNC